MKRVQYHPIFRIIKYFFYLKTCQGYILKIYLIFLVFVSFFCNKLYKPHTYPYTCPKNRYSNQYPSGNKICELKALMDQKDPCVIWYTSSILDNDWVDLYKFSTTKIQCLIFLILFKIYGRNVTQVQYLPT